MATNGQLLARALHGETLLESEILQLARAMDEYDRYSALVKANSEIGSLSLKIPQTFTVISSDVLTVDSASLDYPIPGGFKHLLMIGSGKTTAATGGTLKAQFNGDTGNNYAYADIEGDRVSAFSFGNGAQGYIPVGLFTNSSSTSSGAFAIFIPHYTNTQFRKNVLSIFGSGGARSVNLAGAWLSTDAIIRLTLTTDATNIAQGSLVSIYGIN